MVEGRKRKSSHGTEYWNLNRLLRESLDRGPRKVPEVVNVQNLDWVLSEERDLSSEKVREGVDSLELNSSLLYSVEGCRNPL